jgi:uncharacterized protein
MKHLLSVVGSISCLLLVLAQDAAAAKKEAAIPAPVPAHPAIWVVRDEDTTVWLFGTVHILKPGMDWFGGKVREAFDASGEVVLELVLPDQARMAQMITVLRQKHDVAGALPMVERLPEAEREGYRKTLSNLGIPMRAFDATPPWMVATALEGLALRRIGYDRDNGVERVLSDAAAAAGKPVAGLETAEQQLGFFESLSADAQVALLAGTVDDLANLGEQIDHMVADWSAGDSDAIARLLNDEMKDSPELASVLLHKRNAHWADWIAARMRRPGTVFLAVGAGHLAGPGSLQDELARRRIEAERVQP